MRHIVEYICDEAGSNWDGEYMGLDDVIKDSATRLYLLTTYKSSLGEVFPLCCDGLYEALISALYSDQDRFLRLYFAATIGCTPDECFISEALTSFETEQLKKAYFAKDTPEITKVFSDAIYRYCEDEIREACANLVENIQQNIRESTIANWALQDSKEMACL